MTAVTITEISPLELEGLIEGVVRKLLLESSPKELPLPEDKLLTVQDAASLLRLSVPTIYGLTSRKELPFMKKGKRLYFSEAEIRKYLRSGKSKSISEIEEEAEAHLGSLAIKKGC